MAYRFLIDCDDGQLVREDENYRTDVLTRSSWVRYEINWCTTALGAITVAEAATMAGGVDLAAPADPQSVARAQRRARKQLADQRRREAEVDPAERKRQHFERALSNWAGMHDEALDP